MDATTTEPVTAAYLARRGVSAQWRSFLRALVETLDEHLDAEGRASLMRAVGGRMADASPLPHCDTLAALEARVNEALASSDWGYAEFAVDTAARRLIVTHHAAPAIAAGDDGDGRWITPVLEGLYGTWLAGQPGADAELRPALASYAPGRAVLHYGRA
ncbi:cellulose biosynthesis protein BcsD [Falsiroseomonas sp. CW058]|uniref:cellulose biosynthesis protein BcsD n=1 Tax=Falsiroseomonas sp. CW058 TaxID=3388664 RepID=UPI003D318F42